MHAFHVVYGRRLGDASLLRNDKLGYCELSRYLKKVIQQADVLVHCKVLFDLHAACPLAPLAILQRGEMSARHKLMYFRYYFIGHLLPADANVTCPTLKQHLQEPHQKLMNLWVAVLLGLQLSSAGVEAANLPNTCNGILLPKLDTATHGAMLKSTPALLECCHESPVQHGCV